MILSVGKKNRNFEIIKYLVDLKIDPNLADKNGFTALMTAACHMNPDLLTIMYMVEKGKANVNLTKDKKKKTPLGLACGFKNYDKDVIFYLLSQKADPNIHGPYGMTPFHFFVDKHSDDEVIRYFLENHGDPNARCNDLDTVFLIYCNNVDSTLEGVRLLVEHKADVNATDDFRINSIYNGKFLFLFLFFIFYFLFLFFIFYFIFIFFLKLSLF